MTWALSAGTDGFALTRHNVFFSRDYPAEFDDVFRRGRLPAKPTVYVCAQDRGQPGCSPMTLRERLLVLVNAPANGDRRTFNTMEIEQCATQTFGLLQRCGLTVNRRAGSDSGDDAGRLRQNVSGDRGRALRPGGARLDGGVPPTGIAKRDTGALPGGGQRASGAGRADGGVVGSSGGGEPAAGPGFDLTPPAGGYTWWYVDALSDDGAYGITIIAFIGSVFSPYYAWSRRRGGGDPMRHCALNVALYGQGKRWSMTERGAGAVQRGADFLAIGPSALSWDGSGLTVRIDEMAVPLPRRIRGTVRLYPSAIETRATRSIPPAGTDGGR